MSRSILYVLGVLLVCVGLTLVLPLGVALGYGEQAADGIFQSAVIIVGGGALLALGCRQQTQQPLTHSEGLAAVGLCWLAASVAGALPFVLAGHLSFTDAVFEAASGFTTTGASILADIEATPKGLLMWRSLTHWLGGMGIIVLSLAVQPLLGVGGMQLFRAEVPGPSPDKLTPRLQDTAKLLWAVYGLLTAVLIPLLMVGGMDWFDAVNHTFATVATGGFSTRNASIMAFPQPFIQWTIILFMFAAGINFSLHYRALRGNIYCYFASDECKSYIKIIITAIASIGLFLYFTGTMAVASFKELEILLRAVAFQVVSIITTTGFVTENYSLWPAFCIAALIVLTFIGGSAGSTGGGFKVLRLVVLGRVMRQELFQVLHPRSVRLIKLDGRTVSGDVLAGISGFLLLYLALTVSGTLFVSCFGLDPLTAFTAVLTCLSNVGPGFGAVGPVDNFGHLPAAVKWALSLLMLLGRLEFHALLLLCMPGFWRNN